MPELPEVERARKLIHTTLTGYRIAEVETWDDPIVYTGGITHHQFADEIKGRTITGCTRKGKIFWIDLSGSGRLPVMHFGMNGMIMLKGKEPDWYMRKPKRRAEDKRTWPPEKYVKFLLKLEPTDTSISDEPQELAYLDSRRLGKLRLLPQPVTSHPPISALGFDPYTAPPPLSEFTTLLRARPRSTIKGLIMDQSFSAGVGNWVADEILHLARVHPATPVARLTDEQVGELWRCMLQVVKIAVDVNADHSKFPKDWLFSWRWSKGKKDKNRKVKDTEKGGMRLPDGSSATLKFITVGGRTSAFIEELQKLPEGVVYKEPVKRGKVVKDDDGPESSSDETALSDNAKTPVKEEADASPTVDRRTPSKRVKRKAVVKTEDSSELSEIGHVGEKIPVTRVSTSKRTKRKGPIKAESSSDMSEIEGVASDADESKPVPVALKTISRKAATANGVGNKRKRAITKAANQQSADDAVDQGKSDIVRGRKKRAVPAGKDTVEDSATASRRKRQKVIQQAEESSGLSSAERE